MPASVKLAIFSIPYSRESKWILNSLQSIVNFKFIEEKQCVT